MKEFKLNPKHYQNKKIKPILDCIVAIMLQVLICYNTLDGLHHVFFWPNQYCSNVLELSIPNSIMFSKLIWKFQDVTLELMKTVLKTFIKIISQV